MPVLSPKHLISFFKKEFGVQVSPGTVYPIFKMLEHEGYILRLPNKTNRHYALTLKGRQAFEDFEDYFSDVSRLLDKLRENLGSTNS